MLSTGREIAQANNQPPVAKESCRVRIEASPATGSHLKWSCARLCILCPALSGGPSTNRGWPQSRPPLLSHVVGTMSSRLSSNFRTPYSKIHPAELFVLGLRFCRLCWTCAAPSAKAGLRVVTSAHCAAGAGSPTPLACSPYTSSERLERG